MKIAAVVDLQSLTVINVIIADATVDLPPEGCTLIDVSALSDVGMGDIYDPVQNSFTSVSNNAS